MEENTNLQGLDKKVNEKIYESNMDNIETRIIDSKIAYIKINSFSEFTDGDIDKINELYKDINNYKDYIIDIRCNGGGNENTGGDGVGIDPILFKLPNSGLVVRTTTDKGLNKDGSSNLEKEIYLDLYVNSLDDLVENIKNNN